MAQIEKIAIDCEALKRIMKEKDKGNKKLAEEIGISAWSISQYINGHELPTKITAYAMCMALGCKISDIEKKKEVKPTATEKVFSDKALSDSIKALTAEVLALSADMGKIAAVILDNQKQIAETKAQCELNAEELTGVFNKITECNSTVNKILGNQKHRY